MTEALPTGRITLGARTFPIPTVELGFYNGTDWNLGRDGLFWLAGTATAGASRVADLESVVLTLDERSLDETLETLTGVSQTFYPPGGLSGPKLQLPIASIEGDRVVLALTTELDWDYFPLPERPADYAPYRLSLELYAVVGFRARVPR